MKVFRYMGNAEHRKLYEHRLDVPPPPPSVVPGVPVPIKLQCSIDLCPTAIMTEWMAQVGGHAVFGFEDDTNRIMVELSDERTAVLFDMQFGTYLPEGVTRQPR